MRGTNRVGGHHGVTAGGAGNFAGKGLDTLALLQHGAELLLENDARQALAELLERDLEILVVEELRIVQACADHALVAIDDGVGALGTAVSHDHELAGQLAFGVVDGEIPLVGAMPAAMTSRRRSSERTPAASSTCS